MMESVDMQLLKSCDLQGRRGATPRGATKIKTIITSQMMGKTGIREYGFPIIAIIATYYLLNDYNQCILKKVIP